MTPLNKSQELDARNIMQGLEDFATFMSFTGHHGNMRILSVETAEPTALPQRHLKAVPSTRFEPQAIAV